MTNDLIIATSGFFLTRNSYFTNFTEDDITADLIYNRDIVTSTSKETMDYYVRNEVYRSRTASLAYGKYLSEPVFDNYIALIDITLDILKDMEYLTFFKLQAANNHLSPLAYKFCLDVVSGKFKDTYRDYNILPFSLRFTIDNGMSTTLSLRRIKEVETAATQASHGSWSTLMSSLIEDREAMVTFYKFIFADFY